jgi:hypothetical protein
MFAVWSPAEGQEPADPATDPAEESVPVVPQAAGERAKPGVESPLDASQLVEISMPSPAEYYLALAKATNPRWRRWYRELSQQPPTKRTKVAAGLGMLMAEAHIAAMARDGQRLRNVGSEIGAFAKILGLSEEVAPRIAAIEAGAERGEWAMAHLDLEAMAVGMARKLHEQRDDDLARLVRLGLWVRVLHVGAGVVFAGEVDELVLAAGGELVPIWLGRELAGLSDACRAEEDIAYLTRQLEKLGRIWAPEKLDSGRVYDAEEVEDTRDRLDGIIDHLSKR